MTDAKKAAERYCLKNMDYTIEAKDIFLAGAAWQAEQDKAEIARLREVLKSADLVITQGLYVGSMNASDYETWQSNCNTLWNEIQQALAEKKGDG